MPRGRIYESSSAAIGDTPMIRINRLVPHEHAEVLAKCEFFQPLNSVKDRIGVSMIEAAEREGQVTPQTHIIEPTSGNTGIALAFVCAAKGYRLTLTMPESMSLERRALLRALGASLELTPAADGMPGAIRRATELVSQLDDAWMPQQFENPANIEVHRDTTAQEVLADFPDGVDLLITGVGTGGHITAVSEVLKERFPQLQTFAVEPTASPVISGGSPSPHRLQGIGAGFVPENLHTDTLDGVIQVSEEDGFAYAVRAAREEGIFVGPSSGAALAAVAQKLPDVPDGSTVLTFCYDTGERYFSVDGLFSADGTTVQVGAQP